MLRRAEEQRGHADVARFRRFSEMVERPMGVLDATEAALKEPGAIEGFCQLLRAGNSRARERTVWALGYAAAKGDDIEGAVEELRRAVEGRDPDIVRGSAYALANHCMNRGDLEGVEQL